MKAGLYTLSADVQHPNTKEGSFRVDRRSRDWRQAPLWSKGEQFVVRCRRDYLAEGIMRKAGVALPEGGVVITTLHREAGLAALEVTLDGAGTELIAALEPHLVASEHATRAFLAVERINDHTLRELVCWLGEEGRLSLDDLITAYNVYRAAE